MERLLALCGQLVAQVLAGLAIEPEPRHVERHGEEFLFALQVHGGIRLDKDDGLRPEIGGIEPGVARIKVHQGYGPFDLFAVHIRVLTRAGVYQAPGHPAFGQRRGFDEVGPEAVDWHLFAAADDLQESTLIDRNRDIVFVDCDIVEADCAEALLHDLGRLVGTSIASDSRSQAGKGVHRLLHALDWGRACQLGKIDLGPGRCHAGQNPAEGHPSHR